MNFHDFPSLLSSNPLVFSSFVVPDDNDVLLGQGRGLWTNRGNQKLRNLIQNVKSECSELPDKGGSKTILCYRLLTQIKGRFLKQIKHGTESGWVPLSPEEAVKKIQADIRSSLCADRKKTLQTKPSPVSPKPPNPTSLVGDNVGGQNNAMFLVPFMTGPLGVSASEAHSMMTNPCNHNSFQKMLTTIADAM